MRRMIEEPALGGASTASAFGTWRTLAMLVWRTGVDVSTAQAFHRTASALARKPPGLLVLVHVIERTSAVPEDAVRKVFANVGPDIMAGGKCSIVVAEGDGLRGSLVRGVATGVTLLMRSAFPVKVVATVPDAAAIATSVLETAGHPVGTGRDVATAIERIRAQVRTG